MCQNKEVHIEMERSIQVNVEIGKQSLIYLPMPKTQINFQ